MSEALIQRVAKVIERAQSKGYHGSWTLARLAVLTMGDVSRETLSEAAEKIEKTTPKIRQYSRASRKGWETRKRQQA
jgi:hypothetical protein